MGHRRAASGHQQIVDPLRQEHPIGQFIEASRLRNRWELEDHITRDMRLDWPAIDADGIRKRRAAEHIVAAKLIVALDTPGLSDAELRRQIDDVGVLEPGHRAQECEGLDRLTAALDLAAGEIVRLDAVDRTAVLACKL